MIRIKNPEFSSTKGFLTGNFRSAEKIDLRNDSIMRDLFRRTQNDQIKGFYLVSDKVFTAYHKSPKKDGCIQLSSGFYQDGDLFPCYDCQFETAAEMIKEGYASGIYEIIA